MKIKLLVWELVLEFMLVEVGDGGGGGDGGDY